MTYPFLSTLVIAREAAAAFAPSIRSAHIISQNIIAEAASEGRGPANLPSKDEWFKRIGIDFSIEEMIYLRKYMTWGSYGVNGDQPCTWIPVEELEIDHIKNILITQELDEARKIVLLAILTDKLTAQTGLLKTAISKALDINSFTSAEPHRTQILSDALKG